MEEEVVDKVTVFGGGKCPNLGVANVLIFGVVNVRLANDLPPVSNHDDDCIDQVF